MKKLIVALMLLSLVLSFTGCGSSDQPQQTNAPAPGNETTAPIEEATEGSLKIPEVTTPPAPELKPEGDLGDAYVKISSFELCEAYDGQPAILIVYTFTNNSEENEMAMTKLSDHAYQNGVELEAAFVYDREDIDTNADTKEIQPGASIDIPQIYLLSSETAPVEFEVIEAFSMNPGIVGTTFEISEGGVTELSKAPQGVQDITIGDYLVSIVSYRMTKDYKDRPVIVLELGFTNNGTDSESFGFSLDLTAFQNGIELETAIALDDVDSHTRHAQIRPGAGVTVYCAYILTDESPVDFELSKLISFSDEAYTFTLEIAE